MLVVSLSALEKIKKIYRSPVRGHRPTGWSGPAAIAIAIAIAIHVSITFPTSLLSLLELNRECDPLPAYINSTTTIDLARIDRSVHKSLAITALFFSSSLLEAA